jgi:hypothetical protein
MGGVHGADVQAFQQLGTGRKLDPFHAGADGGQPLFQGALCLLEHENRGGLLVADAKHRAWRRDLGVDAGRGAEPQGGCDKAQGLAAAEAKMGRGHEDVPVVGRCDLGAGSEQRTVEIPGRLAKEGFLRCSCGVRLSTRRQTAALFASRSSTSQRLPRPLHAGCRALLCQPVSRVQQSGEVREL